MVIGARVTQVQRDSICCNITILSGDLKFSALQRMDMTLITLLFP